MANVHHMTRKYGGLSGSFTAQLQQFADETIERADSIFRDVVMSMAGVIVRLSPVDTGNFKGAWRLSIDGYDSTVPETPDKQGGEVLARMLAEVGDLTFGQAAYLQNNLPYAVPLEFGHSTQAPTGIVRIAQAQFQQLVQQAIRENQ
ncbi:tail completion or Neck1 protein [Acinetobacter phage vB_AbaS_Silvergun]